MDIADLLNTAKPTPKATAGGGKNPLPNDKDAEFTEILARTDQPDPSKISLPDGQDRFHDPSQKIGTPFPDGHLTDGHLTVQNAVEIAAPKLPDQFAQPDVTADGKNSALIDPDEAPQDSPPVAATDTVIAAEIDGISSLAIGANSSAPAEAAKMVPLNAAKADTTQPTDKLAPQEIVAQNLTPKTTGPSAELGQTQTTGKTLQTGPPPSTGVATPQLPITAAIELAKAAPQSNDTAPKGASAQGVVPISAPINSSATPPLVMPQEISSDGKGRDGLLDPQTLKSQTQNSTTPNTTVELPPLKPTTIAPPAAVPTPEFNLQNTAAANLSTLGDLPELPVHVTQHLPAMTEASALSTQAAAALKSSSFANGITQQLVATLARGGDGGIEIRLDPPELGRIAMKLVVTEAGSMVNVSADRSEVLDLMRRHEHALIKELNDAGFGDVNLNFGQAQADDQNDDADQGDAPNETANPVNTAQQITALTALTIDSQLDIRL